MIAVRELTELGFSRFKPFLGQRDIADGGAKRNSCKRSRGVLRICRRRSAQMGAPADERAILAQGVSVREQRGAPGAASNGKLELLHRSARGGNRLCAQPGQGIHGSESAAQRRCAEVL